MSKFFAQDCPTCGRRLHVNKHFASGQIVCPHCGGDFRASLCGGVSRPDDDWRPALVRRADELLALLAARPDMTAA